MPIAIEAETVPLHADARDVLRVGGTRVTLDTVVEAWQDGATPEEIVQRYDTLRLADVYAVVGYYLSHREQVEEYLENAREESMKVQADNEKRLDPTGIRARLLARRVATREGR